MMLAARIRRKLWRHVRSVLQRIGGEKYLPLSERSAESRLCAYAVHCRASGLDKLYLVLSFDCDTVEDAAAAVKIYPMLQRLGIPATFAVPGETLLKTAEAYRTLAQQGAQFINHGFLPHAQMQGDRYVPITFYHEMRETDVIEDIEKGHAAIVEAVGCTPLGFRAQHFGYYREPEQLALLYRTAQRLGYRFCSTTLPGRGLAQGAVYVAAEGIMECPLNGSLRQPEVILDSWNYLTDTKDYHLSEGYFEDFKATVDFFQAENLPAVLNYYVDPAHVVGQPPFEQALTYAMSQGVEALDYPALLAKCAA